MISIPLYLDEEQSCSYLPDLRSQFAYVHPDFSLNTQLYTHLIAQGLRRSGNYVYQPRCTACTECITVRLAALHFKESRQQRRVLKKNMDIQVQVKSAVFEQTLLK